MNITISFDSLSSEERIEIAKEVIASNDEEVKRLIRGEETTEVSDVQENEKYAIELINLVSDKILENYLRTNYVPEILLEKVLEKRCVTVIETVINSKFYGQYFRQKYYKSKSEKIRIAVAQCEDTSEEILEKMVKNDRSEKVQCAIAHRNNEEILRMQCENCTNSTKKILAENSSTPIEYLEEWSKEGEIAIVRALVKNDTITPEIIRNLYYATKSLDFKEKCIKRQQCPSDVLCDYIKEARVSGRIEMCKEVFAHNNVSDEVLDILADTYIYVYDMTGWKREECKSMLEKIMDHEMTSDVTKKKLSEFFSRVN